MEQISMQDIFSFPFLNRYPRTYKVLSPEEVQVLKKVNSLSEEILFPRILIQDPLFTFAKNISENSPQVGDILEIHRRAEDPSQISLAYRQVIN